jgi:uncharacterized protein YhdP
VHETRGQLFGGRSRSPAARARARDRDQRARRCAPSPASARSSIIRGARGLSGSAPYTAGVAIKAGRTQITFESSLRGDRERPAAPLAKAAATDAPLRVDIFPVGDRDRISISVAKVVAAEFLRARQGNEMQCSAAAFR